MSSAVSAHGRYRIQTVAELTGVPASTLRAWEQRYGFPAPERTASAYRLYSDGDVARIARVRSLCDGGMAAAEAVAA
ncbi:MAG: MerR family transcriptional regulator, partial [Deltaproteobacteria bacterium]|nr:MerR family transcriptional regulator [Nannocystaceae bacterium]